MPWLVLLATPVCRANRYADGPKEGPLNSHSGFPRGLRSIEGSHLDNAASICLENYVLPASSQISAVERVRMLETAAVELLPSTCYIDTPCGAAEENKTGDSNWCCSSTTRWYKSYPCLPVWTRLSLVGCVGSDCPADWEFDVLWGLLGAGQINIAPPAGWFAACCERRLLIGSCVPPHSSCVSHARSHERDSNGTEIVRHVC